MTADREVQFVAADVLCREALYLDERRWDEWLALYDEKPVFWVPAWKNEDEPTADPSREVSLLYMTTHVELAERVARVRSGKSVASAVLPRTAHAVTNVIAMPGRAPNEIEVCSVAATHIFNVKRREPHLNFARVEHGLIRHGAEWRIARKKVLLLNDYIPTMLDFYTV